MEPLADPFPDEEDVPLSLESPFWNSVDLMGLGQIKITGVITIQTAYDSQLDENRKYACPKKNIPGNYEYTMEERSRAAKAYVPKDERDLRNKVSYYLGIYFWN